MKNSLNFWQLQHLFVILDLSDCRTVDAVLNLTETFKKVFDTVGTLEDTQEKIRHKAQPLIKRQKQEMTDGVDTTEVESMILELDGELKALQLTVPEIDWTDKDKNTIAKAVVFVLETHGTTHTQLTGQRRIEALAAIISAFEVKDTAPNL